MVYLPLRGINFDSTIADKRNTEPSLKAQLGIWWGMVGSLLANVTCHRHVAPKARRAVGLRPLELVSNPPPKQKK